ncbi:type 1 glutamine amidotransferase domain-containing protein [Staphylococcus caprae]|uniref:type 1 glutamine amidotransferase domain-containing protein n=1 Tax=Staphylococcus TaxID=1279 RepID=UPI0008A995D5|nr:type 1 glutamine amidotransferase domain-containing protein [Staphylococcus sp. HMSC62A08]OHS35641.1 glutamine amidotransferase [Staphylococcus sp. HMSC62A08]
MSKKVLFVLTSTKQYPDGTETGLWLEEAGEPYDILTQEGIEVDIASIKGGHVNLDPNSTSDELLNHYSTFVSHLNDTPSIDDINADDYDAIYLPGGHGTVFDFANNEKLANILVHFRDKDKIISSVCHGPSAFVGVKGSNGKYLVDGIQLTAFTDSEEKAMGLEEKVPFLTQSKLEEQGARFVASDDFASHLEEDRKFITGQNPQSSEVIGKALVNALK